MPFEESIDIENRIIEVKSTGIQDADAVGNLWERLLKKARELDIHKFLMDMREAQVADTLTDSFFFAHQVEEIGFTKEDKFASVYTPTSDKQVQQHKFTELLLQGKGYPLKYFTSMDEAKQWLVE